MAQKEQCLFIGIGGHVVAVRPSDGQEIWRQKVKSASFMTVLVSGDAVYAGAGGELFCLDGTTGRIRWRNRLKGLGSGLVSFGRLGGGGGAGDGGRRRCGNHGNGCISGRIVLTRTLAGLRRAEPLDAHPPCHSTPQDGPGRGVTQRGLIQRSFRSAKA